MTEVKLKKTGDQTLKPYKCSECSAVEKHTTNHWGQFYMTKCQTCGKVATWDCMEEPPAGYERVEDWNTAKLGSILDIEAFTDLPNV